MGVAYGRDSLGNLGFWGAYPIIEYPDTIELVDGKGTIKCNLKMYVPAKTRYYAYCLNNETWFCGGRWAVRTFNGYAQWITRAVQVRIVEHNVVVSGGISGSIDTGKRGCGNHDLGTVMFNINIPVKVMDDFPPVDGRYTLEVKLVFKAYSYVIPWDTPQCYRYADTDSASIVFRVTATVKRKVTAYLIVSNVRTVPDVPRTGEPFKVLADIFNSENGSSAGIDIKLAIDGKIVDSKTISIPPGTIKTVEFDVLSVPTGSHEIAVFPWSKNLPNRCNSKFIYEYYI